MAGDQRWQTIPTQLELPEFEQFILPHLSAGRRGPAPKLSLHKIFNYVLKHVYLGCQWKELPIGRDSDSRLEIHHTRIYRIWRRWVANGCIDAIFAGSVSRLHQEASSTPRSFTTMVPPRRRKRAATTSASAGTRR